MYHISTSIIHRNSSYHSSCIFSAFSQRLLSPGSMVGAILDIGKWQQIAEKVITFVVFTVW